MQRILNKICELQEACQQLYGRTFQVTVKMNNRLTSTAGRAFYTTGELEFSTSLYNANVEAFLEDTVVHEFAHVAAFVLYGEKGHGPMWKNVMQALGLPGDRCHSYAIPQRSKAKTTTFKCGCRTHEISPQRKSWMTRGKVYRCVACNEIIVEV